MNTLRPDEQASLAEIERKKKFDANLQRGLKAGTNMALAASGAGLTSRLLPLLSEHLPADLAVKAINKVSPKFGSFLQKGVSMGLDAKEGIQFLKNKLEGSVEERQSSERQLNELGQFSPELQSFVEEQIQAGKSPEHAAALAMNESGLSELVRGIEKQTKSPFTKFVRELYEGKAVQPPQSQSMQPESGSGQQALMAILQKIQQSRGPQ